MKVLFANPPTYQDTGSFNRPIRFPTYSYATPVLHPPLLLANAAAYVRARGHEVKLIDCQVDTINVREFVSKVVDYSPDHVIFETSTPSFANDVQVVREIKARQDCKVVFVGSHVSALPEESMEENCLDAIVVGEYEPSLCDYIENGHDGTKGICYRNEGGEVRLNPPREHLQELDTIPFPARDLLQNYRYFDPILKNPFTFVLGGRGCPYRCTFCNWPQTLMGRRYRLRSVENIADELEMLEKQYSFKSFLFNDDTFTGNRKHALGVCDEIIRRKIRLPWGCYARADITDRELLNALREAGCFLLKVGVESGDQDILDRVNKGYKIAKVMEGVALMNDLGFHVHCTFVFGLPGENEDTIKRTIAFAKRLNPTTVQFSTAVPYPGTELHKYLEEQHYLLTEDWAQYMPMHPIFEYPDLSAKAIAKAVSRAYRQYYLRPKYVKVGLKGMCTTPKTTMSNLRKLVKLWL